MRQAERETIVHAMMPSAPLSTTRCAALLRPLLAGLSLLAVVAPAAAQQARLELGTPDVFVDQPFVATIVVDYTRTAVAPTFPKIPDCDVAYLGEGPSNLVRMDVNGQTSERRTARYRYELTPRRLGVFEIPRIDVPADGRTLRTQAAAFQARADDSASLLSARIVAPPGPLYVGQQVKLRLEISVRQPELRRRGAGMQMRLDGEETWRYIESRTLDPFKNATTWRPESRTGPDGLQHTWFTYVLEDDVILSRSGPLHFEGLMVRMRYPLEYSVDSFGLLSRTELTRVRDLAVTPEPPETEVSPLPLENQPADFTGAIGKFSLATSVSPAEARVGDPIELTIDIRGDGPLDTLPPPPLAQNAELAAVFRVPDEPLAGETLRPSSGQTITARRYRVMLRPTRPTDELPAIGYTYFDPERGEYATAVAPAKPLRITAGERVNATDVVGLAAPPLAAPAAAPQELAGLRPNRTEERALLAAETQVTPLAALLVAGGPPLIFSGIWGAAALARARRNSQANRRRRALSRATQRIRAAEPRTPRELAAEVHAALAAYLADRLNEPEGRYAGRAGADLLAARCPRPELSRRWAALIEETEAASFGGAVAADAQRLARQAHEVLAAAERELT